jgi:flavodoxin
MSFLLIVLLLAVPCSAAMSESFGVLVVYYSRSGNSEVFARALGNHLGTDVQEIHDRKDRSGTWGFISSALDSTFGSEADIEPLHPDLRAYKTIVLVSPIWNWKLCTPIRTFIDKNNLHGKEVLVVTTANIDVKKYDKYGDEASWVKRFLRDYLRTSRDGMRTMVARTGAEVIGHYHIATEGKSEVELKQDAAEMMQNLGRAVHAWVLKNENWPGSILGYAEVSGGRKE